MYVSSSSPFPLATYNKHTNMIKESPLQFSSDSKTFTWNDTL